MDNYFFVFTPQQKNHHSEFYKYIESFPHLPIKRTNDELRQDIHTAIKQQFNFANKNWSKRQLKLRECLKLGEAKYMQFCLDHKADGISIQNAAKELGIFNSAKVSRHNNQHYLEHAEAAAHHH